MRTIVCLRNLSCPPMWPSLYSTTTISQRPRRPPLQPPPLQINNNISRSRFPRHPSHLRTQRTQNQAPQTLQDPPNILKRARRAKTDPDYALVTGTCDAFLHKHQLPLVRLMSVLPEPRRCRTPDDSGVGDSCDGIAHAPAS